MKNIIYLLALVLSISSCEKDEAITESLLPTTARTFISTYFPEAQFTHGEKEKENGVIVFDVKLSNGVDIEFTELGEWISVDCEFSIMPDGIIELLPSGITKYLNEKHPGAKIIQIDKENGMYEIELNAPIEELYFSLNGTFIRYDN